MQIGRKSRVVDMRQIWLTEPRFSDWLVTDEGLALIADEIGVHIENPRRESRPGDFPCDVVGNLQGEESHIVVIENQFGRTDHDHLGKLLTYAAMHSAMTGIWIAERASDDHRQVVEWLNNNTPPSVSLYLLELGAIRIGDSPVAPELRVVSRPNDKRKATVAADQARDLPIHAWRLAFWEDIFEAIVAQTPSFPLKSAGTSPYADVRFEKANIGMSMALIPISRQVRCDLWIAGRNKKGRYAQLFAQRGAIETELGYTLTWEENPDQKSTRISFTLMRDPKDDTKRAEIISWFAQNAPAFYKAFAGRVQALTDTLPDYASEENDPENNEPQEVETDSPSGIL